LIFTRGFTLLKSFNNIFLREYPKKILKA